MKKALSTFLSLFLCVSLAAGFGEKGQAVGYNPYYKIGLFWGPNAMVSANLQNYTGSGYRFGYLDANGEFVCVGQSSETKITMVKNRNVYLSGTTYSDTASEGAALVGCYHQVVSADAGSYDSAAALAAEQRAAGVSAFVSYTNGIWGVRANSYASNGGGCVTGSKYAVSVVVTGTNDIIFQFDGGEKTPLVVMPDISGVEDPITWFKGYRYYGGFIYNRADGNNITVINYVQLQDYIKGVIPYEMSPSWPLEALKAQAVCAKSYTACNKGRHRADGFDLCTETHCQVYRGTSNANETTDRAVDETDGLYLTYGDSVCSTVYHSSNGGATENSGNVWTNDLGYLKGVVDPYEDLQKATNGIWQYTYTNDTLTRLLRENGYTTSGVVNFYVSQYTPTGNVYSVVLEDSSGKKFTFAKEKVRTFFQDSSLGIYTHSQRYTINSGDVAMTTVGESGSRTYSDTSGLYVIGEDGVVSGLPISGSVRIMTGDGKVASLPVTGSPKNGVYVVNGRGWGHNVGMSQWGARGMAEKGYDFEHILKYYFTDTKLTAGS